MKIVVAQWCGQYSLRIHLFQLEQDELVNELEEASWGIGMIAAATAVTHVIFSQHGKNIGFNSFF